MNIVRGIKKEVKKVSRKIFSCYNKEKNPDVVVGIIVNHCQNFKQNFLMLFYGEKFGVVFNQKFVIF